MKLEMYGYTVIVAVNAFLDLFFILSFFFFILSFSGRNQFSLITLINKFGTFSLNRENGVMILFNGLTFDFLISFYFVFPFA